MTKALTARFVEAVKAKPGERATYQDGQVTGLELRVGAGGMKSWSLRYRTKGGRRCRLSLGSYPNTGLGDARAKAILALSRVLEGKDPAEEKKEEKIAARDAERTIGDLADMFFASTEAQLRKASTNQHEEGVWRNHIRHRIGRRPVSDLRRVEVRGLIRDVATASGPRTANYAQAVLRRIYNFAIREEMVEINPAQFRQLFKHQSRERVLTPSELARLWAAFERGKAERGLGFSEPTAITLQLCSTTLQRSGEVIGIHSSEIDWKTLSWTIPAARSKNKRSHHVPLSRLSAQLVRRALVLASVADDDESDIDKPLPKAAARYVGPLFPSVDPDVSTDRHVITRAMNRACTKMKIEDATPHDLRRTGASMLASERCGVRGEVIARILNHTPLGSPVTQVYNRYDYAAEKRAALELWGQTILDIVREVEEADEDQSSSSDISAIRSAHDLIAEAR
jgi:integrase